MTRFACALTGIALLLPCEGRAQDEGWSGAANETRPEVALPIEPASPPAPLGPPYVISVRAEGGLGGGTPGVGGRAALSGEGWLGENFGLGGYGGGAAQSSLCIFCESKSESLWFFGAEVAGRSEARGTYGLFRLGAAYAWGNRDSSTGFSPLGPPAIVTKERTQGAIVSLSGGWAWHPRSVEIDLLLGLDLTTWGSALFTLGAGFGFAAP